MLIRKLIIINKLGLHARATMKLVNLARRYECEIFMRYQNREINAKSIMNVMVLAASQGSEIELVTSGNDEADAMEALTKLINDRFEESE